MTIDLATMAQMSLMWLMDGTSRPWEDMMRHYGFHWGRHQAWIQLRTPCGEVDSNNVILNVMLHHYYVHLFVCLNMDTH
jgi:hypothetical protein